MSTETLIVREVMTTHDGTHLAFCVAGNGAAATVATPRRLSKGDEFRAEHLHPWDAWRYIDEPAGACSPR